MYNYERIKIKSLEGSKFRFKFVIEQELQREWIILKKH